MERNAGMDAPPPAAPGGPRRRALRAAGSLGLAATAALLAPAQAVADRWPERAPVVQTVPVIQRVVEPRRECHGEVVAEPVHRSHRRVDPADWIGPVAGGIAGGALGSQVGGGSGRTAATVAGAVAGTIAGSVLLPPHGRPHEPRIVERVVERCRTVNYSRDVVQGYDVTWRHRGRLFTTRMPYDPGRFVEVAGRGSRHGWDDWGHAAPAVVVVERGGRHGRWHRREDDD